MNNTIILILLPICAAVILYLLIDKSATKRSKFKIYKKPDGSKVKALKARGTVGDLDLSTSPPTITVRLNEKSAIKGKIYKHKIRIKIEGEEEAWYIDNNNNVYMDYEPDLLGYTFVKED